MNQAVYVLAAGRSAIAPRGGALSGLNEVAIGAAVIEALFHRAKMPMQAVDGLLVGNALAAGGNPARRLSLALDLGPKAMALTIDSQCCSGLDAIGLGMALIKAGSHHLVIAGGSESASHAPLRQWPGRDETPGRQQAPFTPWPEDDPDMVIAALDLAIARGITPEQQFEWSIQSHHKAQHEVDRSLIATPSLCINKDSHTRVLTRDVCQRAERVQPHNPTTMAPIADGAAFLVLASERFLRERLSEQGGNGRLGPPGTNGQKEFRRLFVELVSHQTTSASHRLPGLACGSLKPWVDAQISAQSDWRGRLQVELMESFAAQAVANAEDLDLHQANVNAWGGLLATGHPIGASGAVLAARLCHRLQPGNYGFAFIPGAGGVASGLFARRLA